MADEHEASARLAAAYDEFAYPSGVFSQTSPDRLATIATLHGLAAPPIATARFLELGGGDGLNALAFAAAHPNARALSLDFAREPVARGAALAEAARLANARIEMADVVQVAETLEGEFDYIVAHGLYAWVPPAVQTATLRLIGRVLAPEGVAFISYNAMPGGHVRMLLRDMMMHEIAGIEGKRERVSAARLSLQQFARPSDEETPLRAGLRSQAALMLRKSEASLAHDEISEVFDPQWIEVVARAAAAQGLAYLNDAERSILQDGFVDAEDPPLEQAAIVRRAQRHDHARTCFFRESLFVRAGRTIGRRLDPRAATSLWLAFRGSRKGRHVLEYDGAEFEVGDDGLCDLLERAAGIFPDRIALKEEQLSSDQLEALIRMFDRMAIQLHAEPWPGDRNADRPAASRLTQVLLARGDLSVCRLDHHMVSIEAAPARAFLALLDGTRDRAALAAAWSATPHEEEIGVDRALALMERAGVL